MLNQKFKKAVLGIIIISLVFSGGLLLQPKKVTATWPSAILANFGIPDFFTWAGTWISRGVELLMKQKEFVWDGLTSQLGSLVLRQVTQSTISWINSGFQGNPSFIQNPKNFLEDTGDQLVGSFISGTDLRFLCEPFQINVKQALGLQTVSFKEQISCRLTDILANTKGAYEDFVGGDFINGGGWDSWLQITTVPQNNQLGAMIIAQNELDARIAESEDLTKDKLDWGKGFLSYDDCLVRFYDESGKEVGEPFSYQGEKTYSDFITWPAGAVSQGEPECKTLSPGTVISDTLSKTSGLDLEKANMADEVNEVIGALGSFMIQKMLQKGLSKMDDDNWEEDNKAWATYLTDLQQQTAAMVAEAEANAENIGMATTFKKEDGIDLDQINKDMKINPNQFNDALRDLADISGIEIEPETTGTSTDGTNGQGNIDNSTIFALRDKLLSAVDNQISQESVYRGYYQDLIVNTSAVITKLRDIVSCHQSALNSTSVSLSTPERSEFTAIIANATDSLNTNIVPMDTFARKEVTTSNSNIQQLNTVKASLQAVQSQAELTALTPMLKTLSSKLRDQQIINEAETNVSSYQAFLMNYYTEEDEANRNSCRSLLGLQ